MSRREDLEENIRESYALIGQYEAIQRDTDRPEERRRARRIIDEQWELVEDYLDEYLPLCRRLGVNVPDDIAQVGARFDDGAPGGTTLATGEGSVEQPQAPAHPAEVPTERPEQVQRGSEPASERTADHRKLIAAIVVSAVLSLLVGLLSNLAATYLAPTFQSRQWLVYGALILTFAIALPITIYLSRTT